MGTKEIGARGITDVTCVEIIVEVLVGTGNCYVLFDLLFNSRRRHVTCRAGTGVGRHKEFKLRLYLVVHE